jgi:acetyl esterase/lipase
MKNGFPHPTSFTIEAIRNRAEGLHEKINEKLIGTFKGKEEEKEVKINGNTGKISNRFLKNKFNDLDIPITIYTPIDVKKDKMVVFFHGGGKKTRFSFV